ncbi:glycosyltransferase family 2 protein [Neobacillus kokaensis]|uniref:Galactosyltransferase C-terminal domain-containing protein n=1 Tax=Neobacillus kokaensis TaxID=2759023 RepID=A0ABQ3N679_9BACI|nr:galactosyltransferase-related protein [Neobacillus kokaensis]GHH99571.1 hypothetical protein AM1BK_31140 [Neobacillus kokaensis]
MLNNVSILIPYKPDGGPRDRLFNWVKTYYETMMPEVELCIGKSLSHPFNRSRAINIAAKQATRDIFVIADGDVFYEPDSLLQAIELLDQHAWVIPYDKWLDLTQSSTENLLIHPPQLPLPLDVEYSKERKYKNNRLPISGTIIVTRENFYKVRGFDERFKGWGKEDNAFCAAMNTICGPYYRTKNTFLYHLWHPREGLKTHPNMQNNIKLFNRYAKRTGKIGEMTKLINERGHNSSF